MKLINVKVSRLIPARPAEVENLPDDELGRSHEGGWTWILEMLAKKHAAR